MRALGLAAALSAILAAAAAPAIAGPPATGAGTAAPGLDPLRAEHALTVLILEEAERDAAAADWTGELDSRRVARMLDFFVGFVDACHHAKEDRHLFPALRDAGDAGVDSVVAMLAADHLRGRELLGRMERNLLRLRRGHAPGPGPVAGDLAVYAALLQDHIERENALFLRAEPLLPAATQAALAEAYERLENEELGPGYHERYHGVAERILRERR